jgi:hypothetical protein
MEISDEDFQDLKLKFIDLFKNYLIETKNVYHCEQIFYCSGFFCELSEDFLRPKAALNIRYFLQKIRHLLSVLEAIDRDHPRQDFCFDQSHRLC